MGISGRIQPAMEETAQEILQAVGNIEGVSGVLMGADGNKYKIKTGQQYLTTDNINHFAKLDDDWITKYPDAPVSKLSQIIHNFRPLYGDVYIYINSYRVILADIVRQEILLYDENISSEFNFIANTTNAGGLNTTFVYNNRLHIYGHNVQSGTLHRIGFKIYDLNTMQFERKILNSNAINGLTDYGAFTNYTSLFINYLNGDATSGAIVFAPMNGSSNRYWLLRTVEANGVITGFYLDFTAYTLNSTSGAWTSLAFTRNNRIYLFASWSGNTYIQKCYYDPPSLTIKAEATITTASILIPSAARSNIINVFDIGDDQSKVVITGYNDPMMSMLDLNTLTSPSSVSNTANTSKYDPITKTILQYIYTGIFQGVTYVGDKLGRINIVGMQGTNTLAIVDVKTVKMCETIGSATISGGTTYFNNYAPVITLSEAIFHNGVIYAPSTNVSTNNMDGSKVPATKLIPEYSMDGLERVIE